MKLASAPSTVSVTGVSIPGPEKIPAPFCDTVAGKPALTVFLAFDTVNCAVLFPLKSQTALVVTEIVTDPDGCAWAR